METNEKTKKKLKMAVYWGSACGGCCVSVLDVHEKLYDVVEVVDFVFWPLALDIKYKDVEKMPDGYIDVTLYNGAVRNTENELMAILLRQKSKLLVAYGSCAHIGGIPGLANLSNLEQLLERVYETTETTVNPEGIRPQPRYDTPHGEIDLPMMYNGVKRLKDVVCVDYSIPGCPPQTERLVEVLMALINETELPSKGSVIGAWEKGQCDECSRKKTDNKRIKRFYRPWEVEDDGETCFLEQGIICMGPATRGGCGYRCIEGNAPCRGCYGTPTDIADPGAKMMSAIATMVDADDPDEIEEIVEQIVDPAGTFYRFGLPAAIIKKKVMG